MNQILSTHLETNSKTKEKKNWFRFQFTFSIFILILLIGFGIFYFYYLQKKEDFSNSLIANYNIYKLYRSSSNDSNQDTTQKTNNDLFRNYSDT